MAKKKTSMFRGRTSRSMEQSKTDYGYLKLPSDINVFKPEGGTEVTFDILPYVVSDENHIDNKKYAEDAVVGDLWWKRPLRIHRNVGPDGVSIVCPTTFGKKCPICEYGAKRKKAGDEWDDLKEIFPKARTIFLVVPRDTSDCEVDYKEGEVHIMDQSDFIFLNFLDEMVKKDIDNEEFPNPYDGLSLTVYWRNKKFGKNSFAEASKIDFVEREEQYDEKFVNNLPCLDDMVKVLSYKEIDAMYFGMEDLDDEDTDTEELMEEEEAPPRRKKKTNTRIARKTRPEPEEDEEEEAPKKSEEPEMSEERLMKLSRGALNRLAKKNGIDPTDFATDETEDLRAEIAEALNIGGEPEEEPEEEPKKSRRAKKDRCPHGHTFGVSTDTEDECDICDIWDDCSEAKENR